MANEKQKEDFKTAEKLDEQEKELQEITKRKKIRIKYLLKL